MYTYLQHITLLLAVFFTKGRCFVIYGLLICSLNLSAVMVTFQVDMSQMVISPNGVHLAGDFQGWDPSSYTMTNIGGGIYALTIDIPPGTYEFKFINGNAWGQDEQVPASCGVPNGFSIYNRTITITADIVLPAYCYAQCTPCGQANYVMNGSAANLGGDCYQVTPALQWQNGAFWSNTQIDLTEDFNLQFEVNLGTTDADGADGIVFVLQRLGSNILGASGGGMGYSSFGQSLGIEFDTFQNLEFNDPPYDHLSIEINGDVNHYGPNNISWPVQMSSANANTEDGANHIVSIDWKAGTQTLNVFFDCEFRLQATYDLVNQVFGGQPLVFWGFTGATGNLVNAQSVCALPQALLSASYDICPGSNVMINAGPSVDQVYNWSPVNYLSDPAIINPVASPPVTTVYQVTYLDLCNVLVTKSVTVNVLESGAGCFFLPLSLLDVQVTADNNLVHFDWRVSDETGITHYAIESSPSDEFDFSPVMLIPATGINHLISEYSAQCIRYSDDRYYRITAIDVFARREEISGIYYMEGSGKGDYQITYNTSSDQMQLTYQMMNERRALCVFQSDGKLLLRESLEAGTDRALVRCSAENANMIAVCVFSESGELLFSNRIIASVN